MKVIIADDEIKVCQLIEFLVDWKALDMEVVAIVHNGVEAIEAIEKHHPDIAITDIRMPGCDGLDMIEKGRKMAPDMEYIIISGYRQFDYAQKAIRFGVSNYLLKPIDKEELITTLQKMRSQYLEKHEQLSKDEKLKIFERNDKERSRVELFDEIITQKKNKEEVWSISYLNSTYQYRFQEGVFQTAIIKVDGLYHDNQVNEKYMEDKIRHALTNHLELCYDWECAFMNGLCYIILNYEGTEVDLRQYLKKVLDELLLQQDIIQKIKVSIGLGISGTSSTILSERFKTASWAVAQRLVKGTNQIIQGERRSANPFVESNLFKDFNKQLYTAIELQDIDKMKESIADLEIKMKRREETTGYEILQMTKEAMNSYLFAIKKNQFPMGVIEGLFEEFNREVQQYGTAHQIFQYLSNVISTTFEKILKEKQQIDTKPIREAKKYILEHFNEAISLEIVSDIVGFNTAYFSSMFKKETGITFSEYLLGIRMEKAKELIKETKASVADICEAVGYNDVKHFTKNFIKYTSLKPNEYRKLYS